MKAFLLLALISIFGTFIYFKIQVLGDPNSHFNQTTRYALGKYQVMRDILGLHSYGDAREEYFSAGKPIALEVVEAQGTSVGQQALDDWAQYIKTYTGKDAVVFEDQQAQPGTLTDADIEKIASEKRTHAGLGQPDLLVVYAQDYQHSGSEVAKTYQEFGIVLSDSRLRQVTEGFSQSFGQYLDSTFLHELGHQLGLEHNNQSGCIMNPEVESPQSGSVFTGFFTQTQFCDYELKQLNAIKAASN